MVDPESVTARIDRLTPLLGELELIQRAGQEAYATDLRIRLATDHALQLGIQTCIDVGAHLIAELGLDAPSDYRGVFDRLRAAGLDPGVAARLADAVGMRNVLVHGYLDFDDDLVWRALDRLDDLRSFAAFALDQI